MADFKWQTANENARQHNSGLSVDLSFAICHLKSVSRFLSSLNFFWDYLREVSGENDYARYQTTALARGTSPMSAEDFYLWRLRQKYSQINRCC